MNVIQALEIMKTHVVTVRSDSSLSDAIDHMDLYQVDELPVTNDEGKLCGIIHEYDAAAALIDITVDTDSKNHLLDAANVAATARALVDQYMDRRVFSVLDTDELTAELAVKLLKDYRRVPVIDVGQRIVGTLNRVDIIQALFEGTISLT